MVYFKSIIAATIALIGASQAFTPNASNPAAKKVELARAKVQNEYLNLADGMKMVAGGAQAEEYYEGESNKSSPSSVS